MKRGLQSVRADRAWGAIRSLGDSSAAVSRLPSMLLTMGLGQTVAFYLAKDDEVHKTIVDALARHLDSVVGLEQGPLEDPGSDLMKAIINSSISRYLLMSEEALKFAVWLKRLAEAELGGEE